MHYRVRGLALALMAIGATGVQAAGSEMFKFSGFGTLGAVHSTEENADFALYGSQVSGTGYSRDWSLDVDSKLGAQVDAKFTDTLSATLQAVASKRYDNGYTPDLTLAQLRFQATPELAVRVGRMALPQYLVSDYRRVGYAIPWARAPHVIYGNDFFHYDGADVTWKSTAAGWAWSAQALTGYVKTDQPDDGEVIGNHVLGANLTAEKGDHTFRISYVTSKLKVSSALDPLFAAYKVYGGAAGAKVADKYAIDDLGIPYLTLGYMYMPGDWLVMAELGKATPERDGVLPHTTNGYLTVGRRIGEFTPFVNFAFREDDLAKPVSGVVPSLDAGLNKAIAVGDVSQKVASVGVRWDFMKNTALKGQFDHVNLSKGSYGGLLNRQADFKPGGSYNLLSVAVDFVF